MWYGLKIGLTYQETLELPYGELLDLIAVEQIKHEGVKLKPKEDFWDLLEYK